MGLWNILMSSRCRVLFDELRRIALFEFFDDYDITGTIVSGLGIDSLMPDKDGPGQKVGKDRLGESSLLKSLGATFFFFTVLFGIFILVMIALVYLCRNTRLSEANKKRLADLKKKIFFNMLIRYSLLNALKLNLTALMGITASGLEKLPSIALLVVLNLLPFVYSYVLIRKGDELKTEDNVKRYGNLYQDLRLETFEDPPKKRNIWLYPMTFMLRRCIFMVLTVYAFEHPHIQMICHCVLTLVTAVYLSSGALFKERSR